MSTANRRIEFTRHRLDNLDVPATGRAYYYDTLQPGLAVSVHPSGTRTFFLVKKIGKKLERIKLDRDGVIDIKAARKAAKAKLDALAAGVNPAEARRALRTGKTLREVFEHFLENRRSRQGGWLTDNTKSDYRSRFKNYLGKYADRPMGSLSHEELAALHTRIGKAGHLHTANRVVELVSSIYGHATSKSVNLYRGENPAREIVAFPEPAREEWLSDRAELSRFFKALDKTPEPWRWAFSISLFTGVRRAGVLSLRWSDVDLNRRVWSVAKTKGGKPLTLPLSEVAAGVFEQIPRVEGVDYIFPSRAKSKHPYLTEPKKPWADLFKRAKLDDRLTLHDLRRTFASWQIETGSSLPVVGKSLGHTTSKATEVYGRQSLKPMRESIARGTTAMLDEAIAGDEGIAGDDETAAAIARVIGTPKDVVERFFKK